MSSFDMQDEAATLVSALDLALAACGAPWPAFVPVHDALRDAWRGVAAPAGTAAFFDCDSLHSGAPPPRLLQVRAPPSSVHDTLCATKDMLKSLVQVERIVEHALAEQSANRWSICPFSMRQITQDGNARLTSAAHPSYSICHSTACGGVRWRGSCSCWRSSWRAATRRLPLAVLRWPQGPAASSLRQRTA